jgi:hypothetical protein
VRGNRDLVTDGEDGYLVPTDDADAVADRIRRLLADRALYARLSENARARAAAFAVSRVARETEGVYTAYGMAKYPQVVYVTSPHNMLVRQYEEQGYSIRRPFRGGSFLARAVRYGWFRLNLPLKGIWYREIDLDAAELVLVGEWVYGDRYVAWLRRRYPDKRIAYLYANRIADAAALGRIRAAGCEVWTWDRDDALEYGIGWIPTGGYPSFEGVARRDPESDVFFVGRDKGRAERLLWIRERLEGLGLTAEFHITADRPDQARAKPFYRPLIPYEEVVQKTLGTRSILHLIDGAQRGVTLRISESVVLGVKLITDYDGIRAFDFYDEDNIYVLDGENWDGIPAFLSKPYRPVPREIVRKYTIDGLYEGLLKGAFG